MNKRFQLYQQVVLSKGLYEEGLRQGDVATIVEIITKDEKTGYCLEFFDSEGATVKVLVVNEPDIMEVKPHSIVNYRDLQVR